MKRILGIVFLVLIYAVYAVAQSPELKFIADTLVVQANGTYKADPDLATMTFDIFAQDKDLKHAYDTAGVSMQRIIDLAEHNGIRKEDISSGTLTVNPIYTGDRKKSARSYSVQGQLALRIHDFSKIGTILDGSVDDGIADFRSLTYSLDDEESAKKLAVADAMRHAIGRGTIALEQKGQKLGVLRYMSLDVSQLLGVAELQSSTMEAEISSSDAFKGAMWKRRDSVPPPPPPMSHPEKITVTASVQCAFQIQ